jgi:hypothetical protein
MKVSKDGRLYFVKISILLPVIPYSHLAILGFKGKFSLNEKYLRLFAIITFKNTENIIIFTFKYVKEQDTRNVKREE